MYTLWKMQQFQSVSLLYFSLDENWAQQKKWKYQAATSGAEKWSQRIRAKNCDILSMVAWTWLLKQVNTHKTHIKMPILTTEINMFRVVDSTASSGINTRSQGGTEFIF